MIKVGVTGGIGSGKTIVCKVFASLGVPVYYADKAARMLTETNSRIQKELIALLGKDIYNDNGLNRSLMSALIFKNKKLIEDVNRIIHPYVKEDFTNWAEMHHKKDYVIQEAAILFESGSNRLVDICITVTAPLDIKIKRLLLRNGMTEVRIRDIMANQWSDEKKIQLSDFVINNDEKSLILPQILFIHQQLIDINHKRLIE
jgi:dephospho-CoA kinase